MVRRHTRKHRGGVAIPNAPMKVRAQRGNLQRNKTVRQLIRNFEPLHPLTIEYGNQIPSLFNKQLQNRHVNTNKISKITRQYMSRPSQIERETFKLPKGIKANTRKVNSQHQATVIKGAKKLNYITGHNTNKPQYNIWTERNIPIN